MSIQDEKSLEAHEKIEKIKQKNKKLFPSVQSCLFSKHVSYNIFII